MHDSVLWAHKVLVYLVRGRNLLVFRACEDDAWEVPKGGIEAEEPFEAPVAREVLKETGVRPDRLHVLEARTFTSTDGARQRIWHAYWGELPPGRPLRWTHEVTGSGSDAGTCLDVRLLPLESVTLAGSLGPRPLGAWLAER